jgi:hypothetical protein
MEFIRLWWSFYSNKSRGLRKKAGTDDEVPALIDSDISPKAFRKNWTYGMSSVNRLREPTVRQLKP